MKGTFTKIVLAAGMIAGLSIVGLAQSVAPQQQGAPQVGPEARGERRMGRRHKRAMRRHHRRAGLRALKSLNLTDAQREQVRTLSQRFRESNKAARTELRELMRLRREGGQLNADQQARARTLMQTLRERRKAQRQELLATLTNEQRAQLEQLKKERRERREQFRQQRKITRGETM